MKILSLLAQRIVNEVTQVIDEEVIVIDHKGIIIAGSDKFRIGDFHEGALYAIKTGKKFIITPNDVKRLKGVKAGVNLPITFEKEVVGVIGITGHPNLISRYAELIQRMTELIMIEAQAAERLESKKRSLETYIYEWVHTKDMSNELLTRGEILGIPMDLSRICVLIQFNLDESNILREVSFEREIIEYIQSKLGQDGKELIATWGNGLFIFLKPYKDNDNRATLTNSLNTLISYYKREFNYTVRIGIGGGYSSKNLSQSYEEAEQALKATSENKMLMEYEDLTLEMILGEVELETKRKVIKRILGPILEEKELRETLKVYYSRDMSLKDTASSLHIHINTLHYRLKRIQQLTGESLKNPKFLASSYLALLFLEENLDYYTKKY